MAKAFKIRLDAAVEVYRADTSFSLIVCGWHPIKRPDLKRYCEAEVGAAYIREKYGIPVLAESDSQTLQENFLFVGERFPDIVSYKVVMGTNVRGRVEFLARRMLGHRVGLSYTYCNDGVGNPEREKQLLRDIRCILKDVRDGARESLMLPPGNDGRLKSTLGRLAMEHHTCPEHPRP
jgi:hypothetical protein